MKKRDLERLFERDNGQCWHCGTTENLTVQHRMNRGMGGSRLRDNPANLILLCWYSNFEMEASSVKAEVARVSGWKIRNGYIPANVPAFHQPSNTWICLNDDWSIKVVN